MFQKNRFSGFRGTPLDTTLRCVGVDGVIVGFMFASVAGVDEVIAALV